LSAKFSLNFVINGVHRIISFLKVDNRFHVQTAVSNENSRYRSMNANRKDSERPE
jgi:hypothetical protein